MAGTMELTNSPSVMDKEVTPVLDGAEIVASVMAMRAQLEANGAQALQTVQHACQELYQRAVAQYDQVNGEVIVAICEAYVALAATQVRLQGMDRILKRLAVVVTLAAAPIVTAACSGGGGIDTHAQGNAQGNLQPVMEKKEKIETVLWMYEDVCVAERYFERGIGIGWKDILIDIWEENGMTADNTPNYWTLVEQKSKELKAEYEGPPDFYGKYQIPYLAELPGQSR